MKRYKKNAILGGVCAGMAKQLDIPAIVMRILFVLGTLWIGAPLLIYILLWVILPVEEDTTLFEGLNSLKLNKEDKILAGVCSGIAVASGWPAAYVRILWIIGSLYFGFGIAAYIIMWLLMYHNTHKKN